MHIVEIYIFKIRNTHILRTYEIREYGLNPDWTQALAAVREVAPEREVGRLQLEAQVQYRRGNKQDAIQLYSQLFQQHKVSRGFKCWDVPHTAFCAKSQHAEYRCNDLLCGVGSAEG